jgi:hypothetical protein
MPYFAGFAIALAVALSATFVGLDKDRAFYPTVLAVIASVYVLFAAMAGSGGTVIMELTIMAAFLVAVVLGFKRNPWLIVAALVAHGVLDLFHGHVVSNPGVPTWYPTFCLTYDISAAVYLALRLRAGACPFPPTCSTSWTPRAGSHSGSGPPPGSSCGAARQYAVSLAVPRSRKLREKHHVATPHLVGPADHRTRRLRYAAERP